MDRMAKSPPSPVYMAPGMTAALIQAFTAFGRWKARTVRPYRMPELERRLQAAPAHVATVLRTHGWTRDQRRVTRRNRRQRESWWLPPDCPPPPRRPRGRPTTTQFYETQK